MIMKYILLLLLIPSVGFCQDSTKKYQWVVPDSAFKYFQIKTISLSPAMVEHNRKLEIALMKREIAREEVKKESPNGYTFVKREETPDISFRRVGVNAGVISTEINNKAKQSHYFIKFTNNETLSANLERLRRNTFVLNNTIGPNSIAKTELIEMFNKNL